MYCGRRRSLRHFAVFICLTLAPAMFSGALFTSSSLRGRSFAENPASKRFLTFLFFEVARPQLPAGASSSPQSPFCPPLASLAACFPRLAAPLPKNLAAQCFREPFLTSSSLRGLSFIEILALSLFLILFFFQVARSQLAAGAASSPQSSFRPPLASLAACFPYLRLLFPKTLLRNVFGSPFLHRRRSAAAALSKLLLYCSSLLSSFSK